VCAQANTLFEGYQDSQVMHVHGHAHERVA